MSNPNTRTSPPLAGQPFIVEDTVFNTHRQNRSYNLDDTDTSTHTMNNQQDQTTHDLNATTHNVDTDNIQTDNRTEDTDTAQQQQQQTTDQTNSRTDNTETHNRTDNTQHRQQQYQYSTHSATSHRPESSFRFTQSRLQPPPARTYRIDADVHDNMSPSRRQQIFEMRKYLTQLEDPTYRSTYRPSDQASFFRTTAQGRNNQPPPSYNQPAQERGRSQARRQFLPRQQQQQSNFDEISPASPTQEIRMSHHNTSTPTNPQHRNRHDSLGSLIDGLNRITIPKTESVSTLPPLRPTLPPTYVPLEQQTIQMHQKSIEDTLERANMMQTMMKLMLSQRSNTAEDISTDFDRLARQMADDIQLTKQRAEEKSEGMKKAHKIVEYYKTPIQKPPSMELVNTERTRVNLRELIMVTGYFDPQDKDSDFKHVWHKLLDYGQINNYGETHYMTALGAILKKEAYETFCDFKQTDRSLEEILEYFATVYTKKRTIGDAKLAVDTFTRKKGESILACMNRTFLVVDKLRIHYDPNAWIHIRQQMRRHILMQVIKEETKRHIQMEEDYITETTGMPYDFDNLIRKADNFERYNNAVPDKDIQTVFKVASGGIIQKSVNKSPEQQLQHLKKEQMLESRLSSLQARLDQIEVNAIAPRTFKFGDRADRARESRSKDRDTHQRQNRDASQNRSRNLLDDGDVQMMETAPTLTPTPTSQAIQQPNFVPPNPYLEEAKRLRRPKTDNPLQTVRPQQQPQQQQQNRSFSNSNNRPNQGQQRFSNNQPRQPSQSPGRYQQGNNGYPSQQNNRSQTPFENRTRSPSAGSQPASRSQSGNQSWQTRLQKPDNTTITTSGKVYISINGQEYVARPSYRQGN